MKTGFNKDGAPIEIINGQNLNICYDYSVIGDENTIASSEPFPANLN